MQPEGTPFQRQVWQALLELPFGATISYGELPATASSAMTHR
ncbi:methylated-DNA--protein-cysteine methyltransferase [Bordetella pertussis]|nr:methylated-DNA--protein-cysteine methyltransferase [Bordetella pertussis]